MSEQYELDIGERKRDPRKVLRRLIKRRLAQKKYYEKNREPLKQRFRDRFKNISNIREYKDLNTRYLKERIRQCSRRTECSLTPEELLELIPKD